MKVALRSLLVVALVLVVGLSVQAEDKKKEDKKEAKVVTLKGELGCAKCVYKVKGITDCTNAIQVTQGKKKVVYIIDDGGKAEDYHKKICTKKAKGSVKGTVSKKDGKMYIKPEKDGVKIDD